MAVRTVLGFVFLTFFGQAALAQDLIFRPVGAPTVVGSFIGKRALWQNAGTVNGQLVDIVGVLTSTTFDHRFGTGNGQIQVTSVTQDPHFVEFTIYEAGTHDINSNTGGVPVVADVMVQINDIDGPNNEQVYVKMCDGTVEYVRIDKDATTYRGYIDGPNPQFGLDTFYLAGDKGYSNQPESGLEIRYPQTSTFTFGRTANNGFLVRLGNPTYNALDTYDLKCGDFQDPLLLQDDVKEQVLSQPVTLNILFNDSVSTNNDNGPANNSLQPSEYAKQAIDLIPPVTAINLVTDAEGHRVGFEVVGEGVWSYDDDTGELTFTPFVAFFKVPTPINYRFVSPIILPGEPPIYSNTAEVSIDVGSIGLLKKATLVDTNLNGYADEGEFVLYTFTLENFGNLDVTNVTLVESEFSGKGVTPVMEWQSNTLLSPEGTLQAGPPLGEIAVYTALYTVVADDLDTTITNQATASGTTPSGTVVSDDSDSENPQDGDGVASNGPAPGSNDPTTIYLSSGPDRGDAAATYGDPQHTSTSDYWIGDLNGDGDSSAQYSVDATGDDLDGTDDESDEDFPQLYGDLTRSVTVRVNEPVPGSAYLQAFVDFGGDGTFLSLGDQVATDIQDGGPSDLDGVVNGEIKFPITVPVTAVLTPTVVRLRWSSVAGVDSLSTVADGEVEDYGITIITPPPADRGDAPATYGDPQHIVEGTSENYLGVIPPDTDLLSQAGATATGDDLDGNDDEDGVVLPTLYLGGLAEITVDVTDSGSLAPGTSFLQAFIDFNGDGTFGQAGEQVALNLQDGGALDKDGAIDGSITFELAVPAGATTAPTFARFRWSTDNTGAETVFDGEVEDYTLTISSDPAPFLCDASLYFNNVDDRQFKRVTIGATGSTYTTNFQNAAVVSDRDLGNWGYNDLDGYFYSIRDGKDDVYRLVGSGDYDNLSKVEGSAADGSSAGDVMPNGTMVYVDDANTWQLVSLANYGTPFDLTDLGSLQLSQNVNAQDIAYNPVDGFFYGINELSGRPFKVDSNGGLPGNVTVIEFGPNYYAGGFTPFGSIWFDEDGRMYGYSDGGDLLFLVDTTTGQASAIANTSNEGNESDGASCRGPSPLPFGSISGNVFNDNDASDIRDGSETNLGAGIRLDIYDDNGTADLTDDIFLKTVDTLADGTYLFDNLLINETYRVELDEADPEIGGGVLIGTSNPLLGIVVTGNTVTTDQDFGFDPSGSDLSITKIAAATGTTTPITNVSEGDTIDWIITVSNAGSGSPSGVKVIDHIPSGFAYVSDSAPATGDTFDPNTGLWFVDEILAGTSETLIITTTVLGSGDFTNYAEIIYSSLPDPDSDPNTGRVADDFGDGILDDDEAKYSVILDTGVRTLSGRVFIDNGIGGGTAHNAVVDGAELGTKSVVVDVLDGSGGLLASPDVAADGSWSYDLPGTYVGNVTIRATPTAGFLTISEKTDGLPGLVAGDPHDGEFEFEPEAFGGQIQLDIGLVAKPTLSQDQIREIQSGQITVLPHIYEATSDGTVTFSISGESSTPSGAFSSAIYSDLACNGEPDAAITGPISVVADQTICLVTRVSASSGAPNNANYSYTLNGLTTFTGTTVTYTPTDFDVVTVTNLQGEMTLSKTVENETQSTPEGSSNSGSVNDVLLYRIYLRNQSDAAVDDVKVYDRTPAYTSLSEPITTPVVISPSLTCNLVVPVANSIGYEGPVQWNCTGLLQPGDAGRVTFRVAINP